MTHHYTIEIISKKLFFKATYRNNKFRKLEHLRGELDQEIMDAIGQTIPVNEDDIGDFNKKWFKRVNYQIEVKQAKSESLYKRFLDEWFNFYQQMNGIKPKFTGTDGKALNQIIGYFKQLTDTEDEALTGWQLILDNWEYLSDFHKKQVDIKYINSKLNVIITEIKQQIGTTGDVGQQFEV
ncbi:MAG: hypothetical protein KGV59_07585 [Tenacibaculum sp.]|nr:hypothetical protein [Tenacibaculum sp.]